VNMENYFSRLALDIIGKAVFNYDFDSLTHDDPVIEVCTWGLLGGLGCVCNGVGPLKADMGTKLASTELLCITHYSIRGRRAHDNPLNSPSILFLAPCFPPKRV